MLTAKDNGHGAEVFENGERVGVTTAKLLGVPTDGRPVEADAFVLGTANIIEIRRIEGAWCEVAFSGHAELRSHIQVEAEFGPAPQVEGETRRYAIVPLAEPDPIISAAIPKISAHQVVRNSFRLNFGKDCPLSDEQLYWFRDYFGG